MATDDLTLVVGGRQIFGWTGVRVTMGIEHIPNSFEIEMTERLPGDTDFVVQVGDACQVLLGDDTVVTGFIDRYVPSIQGGSHSVAVSGRGKCQDLVDCAAEWPGGQITGSNALAVAQKLCEPYGLTARCLSDPGPQIPQLILNLGETAFDIIERICRYAALLAYEGTDGNLILSQVGSGTAASGLKQGVNVESASITLSVDQQYSEYMVVRMSMDVLSDAGDTGNIVSTVTNPNIKRHRRRIIVAESGDPGSQIAQQRAQWECNRRWGRSAALHVTTDGWRDSAGKLYTPNTLIPFDIPAMKAVPKTWLISEVTFRRDEGGTHCDLMIMPPEAFTPEPVLLQPVAADIPASPSQ